MVAFEAGDAFFQADEWVSEYRRHPEVELHHLAAWIENTTLTFSGGRLSGRIEPDGYVSPKGSPTLQRSRVKAFDLAAFLRERVAKV